jgi:hypothetical protein
MYLARRLDLLGNEEETIANEQLLGELSDMGAKGGKMFYTTDASADYEKYYGGDGTIPTSSLPFYLSLRWCAQIRTALSSSCQPLTITLLTIFTVATGCNKIVAWLEQRGSKFLVGSVPMVADFKFFEYLDTHVGDYYCMVACVLAVANIEVHMELTRPFLPVWSCMWQESISNQILGRGFLGAYPRLQLYHADIKVLPTLKGYFAGEYGNLPMMGPTAKVCEADFAYALHTPSLHQIAWRADRHARLSTHTTRCVPILSCLFQVGNSVDPAASAPLYDMATADAAPSTSADE